MILTNCILILSDWIDLSDFLIVKNPIEIAQAALDSDSDPPL